jgi:pseudaminic acid synthase
VQPKIKKTIQIGKFKVGPDYPPMIIAELSGNHQGSLSRAKELILEAKNAGVHAVKLQTYTADTLTLDIHHGEFMINDSSSLWKGRTLYDLYTEAHTPWNWHQPLFDYGKELGIIVFSSPFDETAIDFLEKLNPPCYKVASPEIVDLPLIAKMAATGKPLIISTGGATLEEIEDAVSTARNRGCHDIILLKCTMAYPANPKDINLRTIPDMAKTFDSLVGLSDHTLGIGVAIASIPYGACVIEKHLTKTRAEGGVDSAFSMEPHEFKLLVEESEKAWQAQGEVKFGPLPSEKSSYAHRPSLYFVEDIPAGAKIQHHHIRSIRPGKGLSPKEIDKVVGSTLMKEVSKGTPVSWDALER